MQVYQLYSDGNYFPRAKKSGFGGHIQAPSGETLVEYTEQIKDHKYSHSFELLGIIRGLQIAKTHNIEHIVSHCDDKNTARKLKEIFEENIFNISPSLKPELYEEIVELSKSFKSIKFEYIPRAQNKHADSLSRRYARLMEENFLKKYETELNFSQAKLEEGVKTTKRIFFSHKNIVTNSHKINPFLVANIRNRRVKKISREQQTHNYHYLFNEIFNKGEEMVLRSFYYDKEDNLKKTFEHTFSGVNHTPEFCSFLASNLEHLQKEEDIKNIWITSNYRVLNAFFEQKEKLPSDEWASFLNVHKALDGFEKVFFHHLPFEHKYSAEIEPVEKVKEKLDEQIFNLDSLLEQLSHKDSPLKEQNKCVGAIIRHELRNYKETLERELEEIEINEVIDQTVASLNAKGYTNLPVIRKNRG